MKKHLARAIAAALALGCAFAHAQQGWRPASQIEFVVPSGAGGAADQYARAMGQALQKMNLLNGQAWVPVNKPSGTGVIALQALQQKAGDPHVMSLLYTGITISNLTGDLKPTPSDFTPVALFLRETMALTVRSDSSLGSASDLVARLKRDPSSVRFGYLGHHVLLSLIKPLKAAGVDVSKLTLVPYRSTAEALTALLGGFVDAVPGSTPNLLGMVNAGRVRALAVSSSERLGGTFGNVPTWKELGVNASFDSVYGVMLPKGISQDATHFWEHAIEQLSSNPEWLAMLERNGARPFFLNHRQTVEYFAKEREELAPLVNELHLKVN